MMLEDFAPSPVDPALYDAIADAGLGRDLFDPHQHECCERVTHYVLHLAADTLERLGALPPTDRAMDVPSLARTAGIVEGFHARLAWLLDLLADAGVVASEGTTYRLLRPLAPACEALRSDARRCDPRYEPTYDLLDEAARLYPPVAHGETLAEPALLARPRLWVRYFNNANPYYALGNHVAARAAAAALPAGARVLEIGGGLGSSAEALFAALGAGARAPGHYRLTDPVPFFRRRSERNVAPPTGTAFEVESLDMNAPWAAQGVAPAAWDLVWGVNAFHLARDQAAVLREALQALRPGGLLVVGEGFRRRRGAPEAAEFPFQLLESYHAVHLAPPDRPGPGFPYPPDLLRALAATGFVDAEAVPSPARVRRYYAGFLGGAIRARRPSDIPASRPT